MSSVNSTNNRYSKEQKQQRSRVLIAQRAKTTILSITMRTTTNHSWSPQDLVTRLHAQWSCASSSLIGHKACAPLDGSWLDTFFLPVRSFPLQRLPCLLQLLFVFGIFITMLHHSSDRSAARQSTPRSRALWMRSSAGDIHGPGRLACASTSVLLRQTLNVWQWEDTNDLQIV